MSLGAPLAGQPNKISVEFCVCKGGGKASISLLSCRVALYNSCNDRQFTDQRPHGLYNGFCLACFVRWFPNILGMGTCSLVMCVMVYLATTVMSLLVVFYILRHTFTSIISAGPKWLLPYAYSGMQLAVCWLSYLVT